jgi:hypothetical protein
MARTRDARLTVQPTTHAVVRLVVCVVSCAALALGVTGCARGGGAAEASPSPTFLDEQAVCEITSTSALRDLLSFWTTGYDYWYGGSTPEQSGLRCRIRGWEPERENSPTLDILYMPGGQLNNIGDRPFTDLDGEGYDPLILDGVEGRGYMWLDSPNVDGVITDVDVAWLYPDNHVLELQYFIKGRPDHGYDDSTLEGVRPLMTTIIPAIPEAAAQPDHRYAKVPADQ